MKYKVTLNGRTYEVEVEHGKAMLLDEYEAIAPAPVAAAPAAAAVAIYIALTTSIRAIHTNRLTMMNVACFMEFFDLAKSFCPQSTKLSKATEILKILSRILAEIVIFAR